VRLIGAGGEQVGVVPTSQALERAREANLDLVEVAPDERPPVCKILDYGKMRYESSLKNNKSGKVHQQKLKEIRVRPKTGEHDVQTKVNQARKFLSTTTRSSSTSSSAAARCSTRRRGDGSSTQSWKNWPTWPRWSVRLRWTAGG